MFTTDRTAKISARILFTILLFGLAQLSAAMSLRNAPQARLQQEVRKQLATLPYYVVFDHVTFRIVPPDTVVLMGQVTRPGLKSDADAAVRKILGIGKVVNKIEVLPDSPVDDSIRWEVFKAIFDKPGLQKYAIQPILPLRIIVKNRKVTLDGMVANQFDRNLIDMSARSVRGTLGVTDDLSVETVGVGPARG
jgi:hyperosmotically inducible protein